MHKITPKKFHTSPSTFSLYSTRSFKIFSKNYPKHVHKLEVDCTPGRFLKPNLIKLIKKSSKFNALQGVNLALDLNARDSQALYAIKKLHRIQSLSLMWDFCNMKIQKEIQRWLRYTSKLHSLLFRQPEGRVLAQQVVQVDTFNFKFARDLRRQRLKKIIHALFHYKHDFRDHYIGNMNNYPSTIQEMSLDVTKCTLTTDPGKPLPQLVSMHKFSSLKKFELLHPVVAEAAFLFLSTIPNPQLLTSLGLCLQSKSSIYGDENPSPIFDFIIKGPKLQKLDLQITHATNKLGLLSRLSSQFEVRILNLMVVIKTDEHFEDLGRFIFIAENLERLDLTVNFSSDPMNQKTFAEFYQGVNQLVRLKKLRLNFTWKPNLKIEPAYSKLVDCLSGLSQLEELSLEIFDAKLYLEFPHILEVLSKIAYQLKKFKIDLSGIHFSEKDQAGFVDTLKKMRGLRELEICQFSFNRSEKSLLKLKAVLEGFEGLKKIIWRGFKIPKGTSEIFFGLMVAMLAKRGVEECRFIRKYDKYSDNMKKITCFDEILS